MSIAVYIAGWVAIVYGGYSIVKYIREARRELNQVSSTWFKEHEYREGQRGFDR